ncbi:MAG TPA: response regulator [Candidatus Hydrogenedentes bacterium]|nr:response regulator [Candidatus Hydrogenedentota bacterium]
MTTSIKICVVDDCIDEATILCEGLKLFGYDAVAAYSGEEALRVVHEQEIHLMLLDVGLPDIDGYEVCKRLKADPSTRDLPVIFVTARGSSGDVAYGYDLGAVDYVAKPYNLPIIIIHVDAALRTRQNTTDIISGPFLLTDPVYTDQLTGLRNRRFLFERLQEETEKAHRYRYPVSCLMVELEEVSSAGDDITESSFEDMLVEVAIAMRNSSRAFDILARYDDTQFAAVLPHIHLEDAVSYANKIRQEVHDATLLDMCPDKESALSFGIVTCANGVRPPSADELLGEAMRNLFRAKSGVANRISARSLEITG